MSKTNFLNSVQFANVPDNTFDLSHDVKMSLNMGKLIPTMVSEVIPGDSWKLSCETMIRMAPMLAPIMHQVNIFTHTFFIPTRLLWPNWEKFITGGEPGDTTPAAPYLEGSITKGSLGDYMGMPVGIVDKFLAFYGSAYQLVWNEYYRDQNLQDPIDFQLVDGDNTSKFSQLMAIRSRAWEHDYFTAALPFAQKGDSVDIPVQGYLPVVVNAYGGAYPGQTAINVHPSQVAGTPGLLTPHTVPSDNPVSLAWPIKDIGAPTAGFMYADGTDATGGTTINELRKAFRLQEWLEKNARGGSRYIESILAHFGVRSDDARLNRPEYISGTKTPMVISEVLQTSETVDSPQGNMAGHGVSVGSGRVGSYYAKEHGIIMTIMSVLPRTSYQNGLNKMFSRFDRLDYLWPTFAHLGEQAVLNKEVYYDAFDGKNDETFGYMPMYGEYRIIPSRVAGDFRDELSYWHMGRIFATRPVLNSNFITADPTHRIFAVEDPSVDKLYCHVFHIIKVKRKLPKYGTPTF